MIGQCAVEILEQLLPFVRNGELPAIEQVAFDVRADTTIGVHCYLWDARLNGGAPISGTIDLANARGVLSLDELKFNLDLALACGRAFYAEQHAVKADPCQNE